MGIIKLAPTPELESRSKVAEEKSPESRLDSKKLLELLETEPEPKKKSNAKQQEYNKKWQAKQSRMTFRMPPEVRTKVDEHAASRGESTTAFIIRSCLEQIERDNNA